MTTSRASASAIPSALVEQMIVDYRTSIGRTPARSSDEEIVQRLVFALVNEAAKILEEGIASRAQRHRHGLPDRLRVPAPSRWPNVLCRYRAASTTWLRP
jgi:hypothetical protein